MSSSDVPDMGAQMMDRAAIDDLLRESGFGVLGLASGGISYPLPMSFGYDGDRCYFAFLRTGEESRKRQFGRNTERASLLVYDVASKHDWRSAIVSGPVSPLPEEDHEAAVTALEDNGWHPSLFSAASPTMGIEWWVMDVVEATGRQSGKAD